MNKDNVQKVLTTLIAAGIITNITCLVKISERLARIETKIEYIEKPQLAKH